MSISTPFIQRPVATSLLMAAILLIGIAAYPLLPVAPLPRVEFPTIQVTANFPGASPPKPWPPPSPSRSSASSPRSPESRR